jgi:SH3 domain protein
VGATASGEKRYVTDVLILTLREGPGNEYKVIKTLRSNMPVTVLQESEAFAEVQTDDGQKGWVAKQYLTTDTPKPIIIAGLNKEVDALKTKVAALAEAGTSADGKLADVKKNQGLRIDELEKDLVRWKNEASSANQKLDDLILQHETFLKESKNTSGLIAERNGLKANNEELVSLNNDLKAQIDALEQDNHRLVRNEIIYWFLAGSGVFFFGLLIGKFSRKKNRY